MPRAIRSTRTVIIQSTMPSSSYLRSTWWNMYLETVMCRETDCSRHSGFTHRPVGLELRHLKTTFLALTDWVFKALCVVTRRHAFAYFPMLHIARGVITNVRFRTNASTHSGCANETNSFIIPEHKDSVIQWNVNGHRLASDSVIMQLLHGGTGPKYVCINKYDILYEYLLIVFPPFQIYILHTSLLNVLYVKGP